MNLIICIKGRLRHLICEMIEERIKMEALFLLVWPLVIFLSYKFTRLNINQLEKLEKI